MKHVIDSELEMVIQSMLCRLLSEQEALQINFKLYDEINALTTLWILPEKHLIIVSADIKNLLKSEEGIRLLYASLAHEIGHIQDMQKTNLYFEKNTSFRTEKELQADGIALFLLGKIFKNPKEILLKEIDFALNATLNCGFATPEEIDCANIFAIARKQAILID